MLYHVLGYHSMCCPRNLSVPIVWVVPFLALLETKLRRQCTRNTSATRTVASHFNTINTWSHRCHTAAALLPHRCLSGHPDLMMIGSLLTSRLIECSGWIGPYEHGMGLIIQPYACGTFCLCRWRRALGQLSTGNPLLYGYNCRMGPMHKAKSLSYAWQGWPDLIHQESW